VTNPQRPGGEWVTQASAALLTDLYELTMAASYLRRGITGPATFDLFVRHLPDNRNFLIACGLDTALEYLESMTFDSDSLGYLESLGLFGDDFLDYLAGFRFTGDVWGIPEGEAVFSCEPMVRVTGPLIEAQIVETFLLNCIGFQTSIASKAARVAIACGDRRFVDFSLRRDHGADAGLKAARASYIGGAVATSNVLAGRIYGIPVNGTMAHSYVMAFEDELQAFRAFAEDFPNDATLLIDTFDVEEGARRAVKVAQELDGGGVRLRGVRIDSGDLSELSRSVRRILDDAGLHDVSVVASGDLDEYRIRDLLAQAAPIDAFGVGTQLGTSGDAPALGGVYKLVAQDSAPKIKLSAGKATLPGRKQVYRFAGGECYESDLIALEDEDVAGGTPLLINVMKNGRRTSSREPLTTARERCARTLDALPTHLKSLEPAPQHYPVRISEELQALVRRMHEEAH
jgi:nicotinate phosphoribosyltransferase